MAAVSHLGMTARSRVTLASAGLFCFYSCWSCCCFSGGLAKVALFLVGVSVCYSDTGEQLPESSVFAELLNIASVAGKNDHHPRIRSSVERVLLFPAVSVSD